MTSQSRFLYRGYGTGRFNTPEHALTPKLIGEFAYTNRFDGSWTYDGSADYGYSARNAVLRHQLKQLGLPTSGVSTTPHRTRALVYAKGKEQCVSTGVILIIDRTLLAENDVRAFIVAETVTNPSVPEDDEVILVGPSGGTLPLQIVVAVKSVSFR